MDQRPGAGRAKREDSSPQLAQHCAVTGTTEGTALPAHTTSTMNALDALEHRKSQDLTPYKVGAWELLLRQCNLLTCHNTLNSLTLYTKASTLAFSPSTLPSPPIIAPPCTYILKPTRRWSRMSSPKASTSAHPPVRRLNNSLVPSSHLHCHGPPNQANLENIALYIIFHTLICLLPLQLLLILPLMQTCSHVHGAHSLPSALLFTTSLPDLRQQSVMLLRHITQYPSPLTNGLAFLVLLVFITPHWFLFSLFVD